MLTNFGDLYERHASGLYRFALRMSGDAALAEDLVSETFLRAWLAPAKTRLPTVKSYLFTIARNLYLTTLRKRSREMELPESLPDGAAASDEMVAGREELRAVAADLARLPELDRAALLLRALDGMPYEEIAAALGLTVAAAKVKVHRARLRLAGLKEA